MTNKIYKMMNWPKIEEIIYSECDNPHEILGPHKAGSQTLIQAYFPGAEKVSIVFGESTFGPGDTKESHFPEKNGIGKNTVIEMELADEDGFFCGAGAGKRKRAACISLYCDRERRK